MRKQSKLFSIVKNAFMHYRKHETRWRACPELANTLFSFIENNYTSQFDQDLFTSLEKLRDLKNIAMKFRNRKAKKSQAVSNTVVPSWYRVSPKSAGSHACYCKLTCENKPFSCFYKNNLPKLCMSSGDYYVYNNNEGTERVLCDQCWQVWIEKPYKESLKLQEAGHEPSRHDKQFWFSSPPVERSGQQFKLCCNSKCEGYESSMIGNPDPLYIYGPSPLHRLCSQCFSTSAVHGTCSCGYIASSDSDASEVSSE